MKQTLLLALAIGASAIMGACSTPAESSGDAESAAPPVSIEEEGADPSANSVIEPVEEPVSDLSETEAPIGGAETEEPLDAVEDPAVVTEEAEEPGSDLTLPGVVDESDAANTEAPAAP